MSDGSTHIKFYIQALTNELQKRKLKNPRYSLRAFAASLGLHPSALSRILAAKQDLSVQSALTIITKLTLTEAEQKRFITSVAEERYARAISVLSETVSQSDLLSPSPNQKITLDAALSFSPDRILVLDLEGRVLYATPGAHPYPSSSRAASQAPGQATSQGMIGQDIVGKKKRDLNLPSRFLEAIEAQSRDVVDTGKSSFIEFKASDFMSEPGESNEWFRRIASAVKDDSGEVEGVLVHIRNITAEKKASRRAELMQSLFASLSQSATMKGSADLVAQHILEATGADVVSVQLTEGGRLKPLSVVATAEGSAQLPEDREAQLNAPGGPHERAMESGEMVWIDRTVDRQTESTMILLAYKAGFQAVGVAPLRFGQASIGTIGFSYLSAHRLTEEDKGFVLTASGICAQALKLAEQRESERSILHTLVDHLPAVTLVVRADLSLEYCSPSYRAFLGFDPVAHSKEVGEAWWHETVPPSDIERLRNEMKAGLASKQVFTLEGYHRQADGSFANVKVQHIPVTGECRQLIAWISIIVEVDGKSVEALPFFQEALQA